MAGESNTVYHHQQAISFQSGAINSNSPNSTTEMIVVPSYFNHPGGNSGGGGGSMVFSGTPASVMNVGNSNQGGSLLLDTVPGLKHDTGLAVEWTVDEQYRLEEGLIKFANEPNIMKYIKIAAVLHEKTVRDVALRCRWMTRKRRKQEDYNMGKKIKDRKDKVGESSVKGNLSSSSALNMSSYSFSMNNYDQMNCIPSGSNVSIGTRHLLEENSQAFGQISVNLSTLKLQENVELFFHTRNNITAILNDMRNMPGIMSQMPPLPVYMNEELVKVLPNSSQGVMFGSSSGVHMKQEPGC